MEKTINRVFRKQTRKYSARVAIEKKRSGRWETVTWNDYYDCARAVGLGLLALGLEAGDRVALLSENRLEWLYSDMGALGVGMVIVPIYTTLADDEVHHIVSHSECRVMVVENRVHLEKALRIAGDLPLLEKIVLIEGKTETPANGPEVLPFERLTGLGREAHAKDPSRFETLAEAVAPSDLATIVYTSGTTGLPKGAMITHNNIMAVVRSLNRIEPPFASDTDNAVPFLPLSHVFERVAGHFYGMSVGLTSSYAESIETFAQDVKEKQPTVVLAVPRVCEKVYQKILAQVQAQSPLKRKIFHWGNTVGRQISALRELKQPVPALAAFKYKVAYHMIFKKIAMALGGRVRWLTAAGAPSSRDIILFFNAAGIMVVEGYGMTETCAPATMSNLADYRIGTVGKPLPGVDVKIAEDGEILIRGENVFAGYWKMEDETRKAFTPDGYLKTGDIGEFNAGFLTITDRKKDLIITSGGKNVAPQKIEGLFKFDPLFAQFVVVGERRKFLSALVNINPEEAARLAKEGNIRFDGIDDLITRPAFLQLVDAHVAECNSHLARYETIKKYRIIPGEFSQESGELTASMKLKRNVINQKYQGLIDAMYTD